MANSFLSNRLEKLEMLIPCNARKVIVLPHGEEIPIPPRNDIFYINIVAQQGSLAALLELTEAPHGATLTQPVLSDAEIDRQLIEYGIDPDKVRLDE